VAELAGFAAAVDTSRRFSGAGAWGDDGLSRTRLAPVLDGDLVRRLDVGQVCYVYRGGVTFLQIKRLTGRQAAIGRGAGGNGDGSDGTGVNAGAAVPVADGSTPAGATTLPLPVIDAVPAGAGAPLAGPPLAPGPPWAPTPRPPTAHSGAAMPGPALPDVSEVLDEAFGQRHE
jgi:hypothetical protein